MPRARRAGQPRGHRPRAAALERHRAEAKLKTLANFDFTLVPAVSKARVRVLASGDVLLESCQVSSRFIAVVHVRPFPARHVSLRKIFASDAMTVAAARSSTRPALAQVSPLCVPPAAETVDGHLTVGIRAEIRPSSAGPPRLATLAAPGRRMTREPARQPHPRSRPCRLPPAPPLAPSPRTHHRSRTRVVLAARNATRYTGYVGSSKRMIVLFQGGHIENCLGTQQRHRWCRDTVFFFSADSQ